MSISKITILLILALTIALAAFCNVYYVTDHVGARVLSHDSEAYLFLGAGHTGYHFSYLKYPLVRFKEFFYAPPFPRDQIVAVTEVRITPSTVERRTVPMPAHSPSTMFFTPFGSGFYVMCGTELCKWTDGGFLPATPEEEQEFGGTKNLYRGDNNGRMVNGWLMWDIPLSSAQKIAVDVGQAGVIQVVNHEAPNSVYADVSVDLIRPGQTPVVLYKVDGHPRRVSKAEYERYFPK